MSTPKPPKDLRPQGRGRKFWREILATYVLRDDEIQVLAETCRTMDTLDALREIVQTEGTTAAGSRGQKVVHPAVAEARQQQLVLSRLLRQLGIPDTPSEPSQGVPSIKSARARKAARARWGDA